MGEHGRTIAVISGGSRGIGRAVAVRLAERGAAVAIGYLRDADAAADVVDVLTRGGSRAVAVQADLAVPGGAAALFDAVAQEWDEPVDVLINSVGCTALTP